MADINLLPSEEKSSDTLNSLQKKLTIFSVAVLAVVAVFTVVTLISFTTAKSAESQLKVDIEKATGDVAANKTTEGLLTIISKKVTSANKVISGRLIYTDVLTKMAELMPTDVYFSDLKITGAKISTSAKAKTSADVANLVSSFVTSDEGKKLFSSISIDSLATDSENNYALCVSMQVNEHKAPEAAK